MKQSSLALVSSLKPGKCTVFFTGYITYLETPPRVESSSLDLDVFPVTSVRSAVTNDISSAKYEPAFPQQLNENLGLQYERVSLIRQVSVECIDRVRCLILHVPAKALFLNERMFTPRSPRGNSLTLTNQKVRC